MILLSFATNGICLIPCLPKKNRNSNEDTCGAKYYSQEVLGYWKETLLLKLCWKLFWMFWDLVFVFFFNLAATIFWVRISDLETHGLSSWWYLVIFSQWAESHVNILASFFFFFNSAFYGSVSTFLMRQANLNRMSLSLGRVVFMASWNYIHKSM